MILLKKIPFLFLVLLISCDLQETDPVHYRNKEIPVSEYDLKYESGNWEHPNYSKAFEFIGNQRVLVEVSDANLEYVMLEIPWRRRDDEPQNKNILIYDSQTNQIIKNRKVLDINNEFGTLIFQPVHNSKQYYIYFLPHHSTGSYYPKLEYDVPNKTASEEWLENMIDIKDIPEAKAISLQSIDDFNTFFPMEVIGSQKEVDIYLSEHPADFYLFPEYRERPIKMQDYLPLHWMKDLEEPNGLNDHAKKGEYYTFQIGLFAPKVDLQEIQVSWSDLDQNRNQSISKENITCFNSGGIDLNGKAFDKTIHVENGKVQALWFGVDIPEQAKPGIYQAEFYIQPEGLEMDTVFLKLEVLNEEIANHGDDEPANMTRLRWLNSTIGTDPDHIIEPYMPVGYEDNTLGIVGRQIQLNEYGFPKHISSFFTQEMTRLQEEPEEILDQSIQFDVLDERGSSIQWTPQNFELQQTHLSVVKWNTENNSDELLMKLSAQLEYDGMLDYKITIIANQDISVKDMKLVIPLKAGAAKYILGLGNKGQKFKKDIQWKWDVTRHQEGAWLGDVNKGLQFVLRDENYERPLNTNFYLSKPLNLPPSWYNEGNGGIHIKRKPDQVTVENYSGPRRLNKGDTLHFNIRFLITPFKVIDTKAHFNTRFVHKYLPIDTVVDLNGTIVNVHHANEINPYINYPFYNMEEQKAYIEEAHQKGIRVKLYNTIRELSYKSYELYPLKSLGDEILNDGKGGGHSWLQEHLKAHYHSAWHATSVNDASILNKGTSRWTNYYIEGINWLAKNQGIDGLYLDDIAFSRETVKRIASVFDTHRDSFVIDLHSANQFNDRDGYINSAFLYMEHFPYISRLWFGEYFEYDLEPDYWLTEVSGIPFGLTGEMLEGGGHPYRGLVYGMTTRVYGKYNPGALWDLFKKFDLANSEMLAYWVDRSPIKTHHKNIKSTVYLNKDKALIAIGSWSDKDEMIALDIDWKAWGFDPSDYRLYAPTIEGLQNQKSYQIGDKISVEKAQGLILILEK